MDLLPEWRTIAFSIVQYGDVRDLQMSLIAGREDTS